jgi:hypothetical protein
MWLADTISISLMIRASIMFISSLVLFVGGTLAWYEVVFQGKNGLTLAIRDTLYAFGLVVLLDTIMIFYVSLVPLQTATFLVLAWLSICANVYLLYMIYRLTLKFVTTEDELNG